MPVGGTSRHFAVLQDLVAIGAWQTSIKPDQSVYESRPDPITENRAGRLLNQYLMAQFVPGPSSCSEQPRHACPSRRYRAVVRRTARATPYVPPPCPRRGARRPIFPWSSGASTAAINLRAS